MRRLDLVPTQPTSQGPGPFPATPHTPEETAAWEAQRIAKSNESAQKKQDRERLEKEGRAAREYSAQWELPAPPEEAEFKLDLEDLVKEFSGGEGIEEVTSLIFDSQPWEDKLASFQ